VFRSLLVSFRVADHGGGDLVIRSLLAASLIRKNPAAIMEFVLREEKVCHLSVENLAEFMARTILFLSKILPARVHARSEFLEIFEFARPIPLIDFLGALMGIPV
jgi:hypothetical protein